MSELVKRLREGTYASYDQCTDAWLAADRIDALEAENKALREGLEWYGEHARLCRLTHSEGDAGRRALDADGGSRARALLAKGDER